MSRPGDLLLDFFFPRRCVFCARPWSSDLPCPDCQRELPWLTGPQAEHRVEFVSLCASPLRYQDKVRQTILRVKFRRRVGLLRGLGPLTAQCAQDHLAGRFDLVTWVPLSPRSLRQRGFDQAQILAKSVAGRFCLPLTPTLQKRGGVKCQSDIRDPAARRANVLGAYSLRPEAEVAGRRVLLVDDVLTTGATLSECARVLRTAGAADVVAVTAARAGDRPRDPL